MSNQQIAEWIDNITQDLVNPDIKLENSLRKTLILAYQIKNDTLKSWVESELNGYSNSDNVPDYRRVHVQLRGRLMLQTFSKLITGAFQNYA